MHQAVHKVMKIHPNPIKIGITIILSYWPWQWHYAITFKKIHKYDKTL